MGQRAAEAACELALDLGSQNGKRRAFLLLVSQEEAATSVCFVCGMVNNTQRNDGDGCVNKLPDELEQIRARKIAEMSKRAEERGLSSRTPGPVEVTDSTFQSTIGANRLVAVDCWAAWCYPCRLIAPIVDELASEYGSRVLFAKLNVDDNPATAMKYSIESIPTILIIRDGVEVDRIVGAVPRQQIEAALRKHL